MAETPDAIRELPKRIVHTRCCTLYSTLHINLLNSLTLDYLGGHITGMAGGGSSLGRYVFGSEISYNKAPPRLPGLAY